MKLNDYKPRTDCQNKAFSFTDSLSYITFFVLCLILLHLPFLARYGIHRDELLWFSSASRLSFGYPDFAPMVVWFTWLSKGLFGKSIIALRFIPLLCGAGLIILTGTMVRELGGRRFAITISSISLILSPYFARSSHYMSQESLAVIFWAAVSLSVLWGLKNGRGVIWLTLGIVYGLGIMARHSILIYGVGIIAGLFLTQYRYHLVGKWLWLSIGMVFLICLPNLFWQLHNDWATITFLKEALKGTGNPNLSEFILGQIFYIGPLRVIICILGLIFLLRSWIDSHHVLGWACLVFFLFLAVTKSKIYYTLPAYTILLAGGSVALEKYITSNFRRKLLIICLLITGTIVLPVSLPILPLKYVDAYAEAITFDKLKNSFEVTGYYHDMIGWESHATSIHEIYKQLPKEIQNRCYFLCSNYGQASALEYFLEFSGRPPVASNHLSWHFWGPPDDVYDVALALSYSNSWLLKMFDKVILVRYTKPVWLAAEKTIPIWLCLKRKGPYHQIWPDKMSFKWL